MSSMANDLFERALRRLLAIEGAFYIGLAERRQKDEPFVYGWLRERVQ